MRLSPAPGFFKITQAFNRFLHRRVSETQLNVRRSAFLMLILLGTVFLSGGCALVPEPKPVQWNQSPDWQVFKGQGVWVAEEGAPEIVADLTLAVGPDEQVWAQLSKTPFPLWTFQRTTDPDVWKIEVPAEGKSWKGRGMGPKQFLAVALAQAWIRGEAPEGWTGSGWDGEIKPADRKGEVEWSLEHKKSGQHLEGFLGNDE